MSVQPVYTAAAFKCTTTLQHWLAEAYVFFAMPYFVYDVAAMFLCHRHNDVIGFLRKEALLVLHHVFMVVFCFPASVFWRGGKGDFFQGVLLLPELSTPFLCLGKVLIQFERQDSLLHKVNGVVMILTFSAASPAVSIHVLRLQPVLAPWQCNVGAALLWPLQLYWFFLLCRAALRSYWPLERCDVTETQQ
uniref:TLC domain containing 3B n=1 Tax=Neogobius melanostomus TaxID=47308 RepID=A0A8C6T4A7_9GOBI